MRAGAHALTLVSLPLNVEVLTALEAGPRPLVDLRRTTGSPPPTTMRKHLKALAEQGVLEKRREAGFPGSVDYQLGRAGHELLPVAQMIQDWLADAPNGSITLGTPAAKNAIKALVDGWCSMIARALAARPLSLTELNKLISGLNYPSLERRLAAMRLAGLIEACRGEGRGTPYEATPWLRRAVAPLGAAARWERRFLPDQTTPIGRIDIEAAFLLAAPMLSVTPGISGTCRIAVEIRRDGHDPGLAGVLVRLDEGRVASCVSKLDGHVDASVSGSVSGWFDALLHKDPGGLEASGDHELCNAVLSGFTSALYPARQAA